MTKYRISSFNISKISAQCSTMFKVNFSELFPTKWCFIIFFSYMALFVTQGLLVTVTQDSSNFYNYNTVLVVLITEFFKLIMSAISYCSRNSFFSLYEQSIIHFKLFWLYSIPSFLYCIYNNLAYVNLLNYDPATYFILLQLRVVITGVLFQALFSKVLNFTQWVSLIVLTIGCMTKNFNFENIQISAVGSNSFTSQETVHNSSTVKMDGMGLNYSTSLIILQVLCSCFAGVYCEYLIKNRGLNVDIFLQNVFMYFDSIVCNVFILFIQRDMPVFSKNSFYEILQPMVFLVILNGALGGIVTSFFLKYLNSVLKTVASALELIFITIFSWILFNVPIKFNTMISISLILTAIILYSRNPVQNPSRSGDTKKSLNEDV